MANVSVFFYGSYMNFAVLAEAGIERRDFKIVNAPGFDLVIAPRANLLRDQGACVYGIMTDLSHAELEHLYGPFAQNQLGQRYLPQAVLVRDRDLAWYPTMTYVCHHMAYEKADPDYVRRILEPASGYRFPPSYLDHIASFS